MKKQLILLMLGTSFGWVNNALAYLGPNDLGKKVTPTLKGANCSPATAKLILEFNDVKALIEQGEVCSRTVQQVLHLMRYRKEVDCM
ncbi:MAG: hypothetical protein LW688_09630 [Cryomorphaceae bacterium]|nr:hypothetical protein [Cryomorphaceae bacterium]